MVLKGCKGPCLSDRHMQILLSQVRAPRPTDSLNYGLLITSFVSAGYSDRTFKLLDKKFPKDSLMRDIDLGIRARMRKVFPACLAPAAM